MLVMSYGAMKAVAADYVELKHVIDLVEKHLFADKACPRIDDAGIVYDPVPKEQWKSMPLGKELR